MARIIKTIEIEGHPVVALENRKVDMAIKEMEVVAMGDLVVDQKTLDEAGLHGRLRVIVQKGEIRILSETASDSEDALEDLAGCLGQEPAAEYDFHLKIGGET